MQSMKLNKLIKTVLFAFGAMMFSAGVLAADEMTPGFAAPEEPARITYESYSGLSELVSIVCDDAINHFQGFFGYTVVKVEPFLTVDEFQKNKISKLGITFADQMIAMINNETAVNAKGKGAGQVRHEQKLAGVLQEVDGYLRLHISGRNVYGERLSYVANIEMSEAIYRALHTYL